MALRTIPVVLSYCAALAQYAPGAVLINFTNPAGLITQAISSACHGPRGRGLRHPERGAGPAGRFPGRRPRPGRFSYGGLNHLGWISSFRVGGEERIGTLLERYEELQRFDHRFAAFDPGLVRRLGAIPTEYDYYYYEPRRYVDAVAKAGGSRGADVLRLNTGLLAEVAKAFAAGDVHDAWTPTSPRWGSAGPATCGPTWRARACRCRLPGRAPPPAATPPTTTRATWARRAARPTVPAVTKESRSR